MVWTDLSMRWVSPLLRASRANKPTFHKFGQLSKAGDLGRQLIERLAMGNKKIDGRAQLGLQEKHLKKGLGSLGLPEGRVIPAEKITTKGV